ncbi:STAS domain-containing protein [Streptomyces sp. NPDC086023]|uniref:STAS domain-containing protein n=1 Tax=Streptomyces sp. NPDC086023 TaxID=3365746 RepID=UPI0037D1D36B
MGPGSSLIEVVPAERQQGGGTGRRRFVIRVTGELDINHAGDLRDALHTLVAGAEPPADIVVDLSNSSFCDSSGLNALLDGRLAALERGHTVSLAAPSHQMLRLLDLTGTTDLFPVGPAVD